MTRLEELEASIVITQEEIRKKKEWLKYLQDEKAKEICPYHIFTVYKSPKFKFYCIREIKSNKNGQSYIIKASRYINGDTLGDILKKKLQTIQITNKWKKEGFFKGS